MNCNNMLFSAVLLFLVTIININGEEVDYGFNLSACSKISPLVKPMKNLKLSELKGPWITANKASFGTESVTRFIIDQDQSRVADFTIKVDQKDQKFAQVHDCIKHEITNLKDGKVLVESSLYFENSYHNTAYNTTFTVNNNNQGNWESVNTQYEDVLILHAEPDKYMVFALCERYTYDESEDTIHTTIITLVRDHKKLNEEKQIKILQDIAVQLGERKFLAAQLQSDSCNSATSINIGFLYFITTLFIFVNNYFV